jgi:hypothetical protein
MSEAPLVRASHGEKAETIGAVMNDLYRPKWQW